MADRGYIEHFVRKHGPCSVSQIAERTGEAHGTTLGRVIKLIDAGKLIDLGGGQLKAAPTKWERDPDEAPPVQERVWKTCCMLSLRGLFERSKVALLAEAGTGYVADYLRWLQKQGFVIVHHRPGKTNLYRVHPDAPGELDAPVWVNRANRALRRKKKAVK